MAWGQKKRSGRKEPVFSGFGASLSELRINPLDRITIADDKPPARRARPRKAAAPSSEGPRRPPGERRGRAKKRTRARLSRLFYWGAVLALWAVIAVGGLLIYIGAHLPPIQSLEIPKRPPTIQVVAADGSVLATRGEMAGSNVLLKDVPSYLPNAFIAIEDRRFYSHYGVDPIGIAR
ncbi:MAG TPA: transglycosylase domain-containing protein, partial [Bradyrhizobium sp.]|nr:transglycosylase domain-containing protein [Bradyrhizobium sp.]